MTTDGAPPPEIKMNDLFQLVESHRPYLEAGNYLVEVDNVLQTDKDGSKDNVTFTAPPVNIAVLGERFSLPDDLIHAVFPPMGARGKFDHALPHVLLNRSSLPWERMPLGHGKIDRLAPSWLALLVFSEKQAKSITTKTVRVSVEKDDTSETLTSSGVDFGEPLPSEVGQHPSDQVDVIDVPFDLLSAVLPRYHDLEALSHVRRVSAGGADLPDKLSIRLAEDHDDATGEGEGPSAAISPELAVIVANRLPPTKGKCTVHLVSLERRYRDMDSPKVKSEKKPAPEKNPRTAHVLTDPRLIKWLQDAHKQRQIKDAFGVDFMVMMNMQPMARLVQDRAHPGAEHHKPIKGTSKMDAKISDAMCQDLIGDEAHWLELLKKNGTVRMTRPLSAASGVIGLFETTITHNGWTPANPGDENILTLEDVALMEKVTPALKKTNKAVLTLTSDSLTKPSTHLINALSVWSSALALEMLLPQLADTQAALSNLGSVKAPADLCEAMTTRHDLKAKIAVELESKNTKAVSQKLTNAAELFASDSVNVDFEVVGVRLGAEITHVDGTCHISVTGRTPRLMAEVRALRNEPVFGTGAETGKKPVRLVSLKSWSFENIEEHRSFAKMMMGLNAINKEQKGIDGKTNIQSLDAGFHLPVPQITDTAPKDRPLIKAGRSYLQAGSVALPHATRSGETTLSWYRGPFVNTGFRPSKLPLPARGADELLIYDDAVGMFDVSYAAAWELGRLITLKDNDFAMALLHWKREHARTLAHLRQRYDHDYLPVTQPDGPSAPPEKLTAGFDRLTRLEPVPFNYLVPDETMLPTDSMRFFDVDPMWLEALRDGAFSIGRVLPKDHLDDAKHHEELPKPARLSGVLIRSGAIGEWQRLRVDGYTGMDREKVDLSENPTYFEHKLKLERFSRLGPDLLLCLFSDAQHHHRPVQMIDIHLPAEILHSGLEVSAENATARIKRLRSPNNGTPLHSFAPMPADQDTQNPHARFTLSDETLGLISSTGATDKDMITLSKIQGQEFMTQNALLNEVSSVSAATKAQLATLIHPEVPKEEFVETIKLETGEAAGKFDVMRLQDQIANHLAAEYNPGHRFSSADFALQMLDLPPIVRFVRPSTTPQGSPK